MPLPLALLLWAVYPNDDSKSQDDDLVAPINLNIEFDPPQRLL